MLALYDPGEEHGSRHKLFAARVAAVDAANRRSRISSAVNIDRERERKSLIV